MSFSVSVYGHHSGYLLLQKYISVNFISHLKRFDDSFKSCYYDELPKHYSSLVLAVAYIWYYNHLNVWIDSLIVWQSYLILSPGVPPYGGQTTCSHKKKSSYRQFKYLNKLTVLHIFINKVMWETMMSNIQYANAAFINSQLDTNKLKAFWGGGGGGGFPKAKRA